MSKKINYKGKPAIIMAEVNRRNPTFDNHLNVIEPGGVYCQIQVDGQEMFDWVPYEQLYDLAGDPLR